MNWYSMSKSALHDKLVSLRPALAMAAQKVHDGHGGTGDMLQGTADAMADVLVENGLQVYVMESNLGQRHVWPIAYDNSEAWHVDLPPEINEDRDVQIDETDISISRADRATLDFVRG